MEKKDKYVAYFMWALFLVLISVNFGYNLGKDLYHIMN